MKNIPIKGLQAATFADIYDTSIVRKSTLQIKEPPVSTDIAYEVHEFDITTKVCANNNIKVTINGIDFHYNPFEVSINKELANYLYDFSLQAEDKTYSIYHDNNILVIY